MSIIRVEKRANPFVQIDKTGVYDRRLSWKAVGLLTYLLSKPDDWEVYVTELVGSHADGKDATQTGIDELIEFGYIERTEKDRKAGKFTGYDYVVREIPTTEPELPKHLARTVSENPQRLKTPQDPENTPKSANTANRTVADLPQRMNRNGKPATSNKDSSNNEVSNNEISNTTRVPSIYVKEIYDAYPRKVQPAPAKKAIAQAIRRVAYGLKNQAPDKAIETAYEFLLNRTLTFAETPKGKAGRYTPYPTTFYNDERYTEPTREWELEAAPGPKLYTWEEKLRAIDKGTPDSKFTDSGETDEQGRVLWVLASQADQLKTNN